MIDPRDIPIILAAWILLVIVLALLPAGCNPDLQTIEKECLNAQK